MKQSMVKPMARSQCQVTTRKHEKELKEIETKTRCSLSTIIPFVLHKDVS